MSLRGNVVLDSEVDTTMRFALCDPSITQLARESSVERYISSGKKSVEISSHYSDL